MSTLKEEPDVLLDKPEFTTFRASYSSQKLTIAVRTCTYFHFYRPLSFPILLLSVWRSAQRVTVIAGAIIFFTSSNSHRSHPLPISKHLLTSELFVFDCSCYLTTLYRQGFSIRWLLFSLESAKRKYCPSQSCVIPTRISLFPSLSLTPSLTISFSLSLSPSFSLPLSHLLTLSHPLSLSFSLTLLLFISLSLSLSFSLNLSFSLSLSLSLFHSLFLTLFQTLSLTLSLFLSLCVHVPFSHVL